VITFCLKAPDGRERRRRGTVNSIDMAAIREQIEEWIEAWVVVESGRPYIAQATYEPEQAVVELQRKLRDRGFEIREASRDQS
jgi:hypothetical protein